MLTPWRRLDIQSKLMVMLLIASILSAVVAGFAGYRSGSSALRDAAYDRLATQRVSKAREISTYLERLRASVVLYSGNQSASNAMAAFTAGYDALDTAPVTATQTSALDSYYTKTFLPALAKNSDGEPAADSYLPRTPAATYLQAHYTAPFATFDDAIKNDDAGDGSAWSAAHALYHPYFRDVAERNGFEDAMLVDVKGDIVYTAYKGVDLGTNILTGPYGSPALTTAFTSVLRSNAVDSAIITDFSPYQPSADKPTAFALSPIGTNGNVTGVLMVQLPVDTINSIMTNGGSGAADPGAARQAWKSSGFGDSGEIFLVGPDNLMRSTSRLLVEDPAAYRTEVVDNGTSPVVAERAVRNGTTIGYQPLKGPQIDAALRGQSGTGSKTSYLGRTVLVSYQPLEDRDVGWAVVSQIDESEALAAVTTLLRNLVVATLAVILFVSVGSLVAAQVFVRPVKNLVGGVRRVAGGDLKARVDLPDGDEFGDLGDAFNDMAGNLETKQELLDQQLAENERLLLTMMPETMAKRYRTGDEAIVEEHQDVSVCFATLSGYDEFSRSMTSEKSVTLLNEIAVGFEAAATELGMERVRILRSGYIASCGLVVPRIDHAVRTLEFALRMIAVVDRFNGQHGAKLAVRVGIDSGTVTSGLVGGNAVYDMWGDSVDLAFGVQSLSDRPGIYVSDRVHEEVRDSFSFVSAGSIETPQGPKPVWELAPGGVGA